MVGAAGQLTLARGRELDEDDVRARANPRGTRPRSKQRPAHDDAETGTVFSVDRGRYGVMIDGIEVTAMKARELGRTSMVIGDRVGVVGDLSGAHDTLARIVRVDERDTVLRRTADDNDPHERVIVANADQLLIVSALADPEPSYGFIDRCLVAALAAGIEPILCLTKSDLASARAGVRALRGAVGSGRRDPARRLAGRDPRPSVGAHHRAGRAFRRRQVDAHQRVGAYGGPRNRAWSARSARAGTRRRRPSRSGCPTTRAG